MTASITCPHCGKTSYHPRDVEERYCGNCHQFHEFMMRSEFQWHGVYCEKAAHDPRRGGYLHAADDDRPYDVDGVRYCGRCHLVL